MTGDPTLSISSVTHIIYAPLEKVDIADWLFNLPDAEYQRCSHADMAAGHTTSDDGRPMSINVETIGLARHLWFSTLLQKSGNRISAA
jgi:hypothetical protein